MGLLLDVGDPGDDRGDWASRLLWVGLMAWLSPVILAVVAIGLVSVATTRAAGLVGKVAPAGAMVASSRPPATPDLAEA